MTESGFTTKTATESKAHIVLVIHGIGCSESAVHTHTEDFLDSVRAVQEKWFTNDKILMKLHLINWKKIIMDAQNYVLDRITLSTSKLTRQMINLTVADLMCYLNPRYGDLILTEVSKSSNAAVTSIKQNSPRFADASVSIIGYSLGSVIGYELISRHIVRPTAFSSTNKPPALNFNVSNFFCMGSPLASFILLQKPEVQLIICKVCKTQNDVSQLLKSGFQMPSSLKFYNMFHPQDPVVRPNNFYCSIGYCGIQAFRMEPIFYPQWKTLPPPVLVPYWRNKGYRDWVEWEKNVKATSIAVVHNITSVASSLYSWVANASASSSVLVGNIIPRSIKGKTNQLQDFRCRIRGLRDEQVDGPLGAVPPVGFDECTVVEQQNEEDKLNEPLSPVACPDSEVQQNANNQSSASVPTSGTYNFTARAYSMGSADAIPEGELIRYDYQLQEKVTEHLFNAYGMLQSHFSYWRLKDAAFFILNTLVQNETDKQ